MFRVMLSVQAIFWTKVIQDAVSVILVRKTRIKNKMSFSRSTSTLPLPVNYRQDCISAATKRYKYLRRIIMFKQMDFEFALWQMFYLFIAPQKVYRNFQYRKRKCSEHCFIYSYVYVRKIFVETKSQFARDDPAFLVLLGGCLCGEFPFLFT